MNKKETQKVVVIDKLLLNWGILFIIMLGVWAIMIKSVWWVLCQL